MDLGVVANSGGGENPGSVEYWDSGGITNFDGATDSGGVVDTGVGKSSGSFTNLRGCEN